MIPKRKYVRKAKKVELGLLPVLEENSGLRPVLEENSGLEKVLETLTVAPREEPYHILKKYDLVHIYVYYESTRCNLDTLRYIKEFQTACERRLIGTQVVVCCSSGYEKIGLSNCFLTENPLNKWTDLIINNELMKCLKIKERPRISAEELFELVKNKEAYSDDFVEIIIA